MEWTYRVTILSKFFRLAKKSISSSHSICFWIPAECLAKQQRYYYFNSETSGIHTMWHVGMSERMHLDCLSKWSLEKIFMLFNLRMCVCVCLWEKGASTGLWLDQRRKDKFTYAYWHTYESPYVRLPVIAFEVKRKKDLCFRTYALFSRIRACTGCRVSNQECLSLIPSFIIEGACAHLSMTTCQFTGIACVPPKSDLCGSGLDLFTCPLWHQQVVPVTWPSKLWPVLTLLVEEDAVVFKRSGRALCLFYPCIIKNLWV